MQLEYASAFQRKLGQHGLNRSLVRSDRSDTPKSDRGFVFKTISIFVLMVSKTLPSFARVGVL
jgi:hypothetical protein